MWLADGLTKNVLPQAAHTKDLLSPWVRTCLARLVLWENAFLHTSHSKGFSPVCVREWFSSTAPLANRLSHTWQTNGSSSSMDRFTCFFMWRWKRPTLVKCRSHVSHFVPGMLCLSLCSFKLPWVAKFFSHRSQLYGRTPVCVRMWLLRWCLSYLYR